MRHLHHLAAEQECDPAQPSRPWPCPGWYIRGVVGMMRTYLTYLGLAILSLAGCADFRQAESARPPAQPRVRPTLTPTRIDYVDADGFDALLESALVNQDPIILI